jgi:chemotaxis protein MotB
MPKDGPPIVVIKRVKKGGHGHHGGAWKIAYADFVTAMMAFFLLMWVLGSTTAGDLAGISSYFQNPLRISMAGGQGSGDTTRIVKSGGGSITLTTGQEAKADADTDERRVSNSKATEVENARRDNTSLTSSVTQGGPGGEKSGQGNGQGGPGSGQANGQGSGQANGQGSGQGNASAQAVQQKIDDDMKNDPELGKLKGQVFMDITAEGLRIQVVDDKNRPIFASGGTTPTDSGRRLLHVIGKALAESPSPIRIEGHTDSSKYSNGKAGYSNWDLSAERANIARREMISGGLKEDKVSQVIGFADKYPINPEDPTDPLNRRISITLLKQKPQVAASKISNLSQNERGGIPPGGVKVGAQDIPENLRAPDPKNKDGNPIAPFSLPTNPAIAPKMMNR